MEATKKRLDSVVLEETAAEGQLRITLTANREIKAIAIGEGVTVPMRLCFDTLPDGERPRSETADFTASWQRTTDHGSLVGDIVRRWRWRGR